MTRASLREYAAVQRERYLRAPRAEKHRLLTEVVAVTGLHRKAAIRLLRRPLRPATSRPRSGRPRRYGPAVAAAARLLSEATGHIGPHRWHPFLPELLDRLTRSGDVGVTPEVDKHLRQVSPATLARLLAPFRRTLPPGVSRRPAPAPGSSTRSLSAPSPSGPTPSPASSNWTWSPTAAPPPRASTSTPSAPSMSRPRGSTSKPSGVRARNGSAPPSTTSASACRSPCAAWIATTAPSSSTTTCMPGASARASPSPAAARTRRTTAPTSSRKTAPSFARSSAMIATPPRPPMPSSLACTTSRACTSTSSNRSSSSCARSAAARACIACTIAPAPRISGSGRRACSPPVVGRSSRRCISA